jgi:2-methylcitrate dehydratase PrpD
VSDFLSAVCRWLDRYDGWLAHRAWNACSDLVTAVMAVERRWDCYRGRHWYRVDGLGELRCLYCRAECDL